ncbi:uncharacterized protein [Amphiura filiformis]|uniref:uncharacterized protein n=1 Tax=Amphiura filiformis TaxID=82378 RepID=UPI003B22013B
MLGSPLTAGSEYCNPATIYTLIPIKEVQGTGILQSSPPNVVLIQPSSQQSQKQQQQQQKRSKFTPIRPAPILCPVPVAPVIVTPNTKKRGKPSTVREMLRTRKMEKQQKQQRQMAAYQIIQHQVPPNTQGQHSMKKQSASSGKMKSERKKKGRPLLPENVASMDKKEIHRVNERHRHRNMNQAIGQLMSVLPKNSAPETETKQFVLQKANDYLTYLRNKIDHVCDEMTVIQDDEEEGLMRFDIPFESTTATKKVSVPASKPITHSDLKNLLGHTSGLKLTEPPKRKSPCTVPPVLLTKPKHQPWYEINIKMCVSPYKKKSPKGQAPSSTKSSKRSGSKKKTSKQKTSVRKIHTTKGGHHTITHDESSDQVSSFQSPSSVCSWASIGDIKDERRVDSSTQSSTQSSSQSYPPVKCEILSDDDVDVDLTCVDYDLNLDEKDDSLRTNSTSKEDGIKFHQLPSPEPHPISMYVSSSSYEDEVQYGHHLTGSPPPSYIHEDHLSEDCESIPWIRYGLTPLSGLGATDGQLQMDHSYSARALSPLTLQALRSSAGKELPESALPSTLHDEFTAGSACGRSTTGDPTWRRSPTCQEPPQHNVDALLQTAILMEPPEDCIPPKSPVNDGNIDVIRVFGLDFDEDSESSGGSFSQSSPEMIEVGVVPMMEQPDPVTTSFGHKQSSMRRSWINGYQLFTKINHARIKESWPGLQGREITRLLGQSWKDLPDAYKKLYSIRACEWNQWYRQKRIQTKQNY